MRLVACTTQTSVIDPILTHLRTRAPREAHAGPQIGPRRHPPHGARRSHGPRGARARRRARRRPSIGARAGGDRVVYSTDSRPAPIEIPIPRRVRDAGMVGYVSPAEFEEQFHRIQAAPAERLTLN